MILPELNFVKSLWLNERLFVLFGAEYAEDITNNAFLLYKIYLEDKNELKNKIKYIINNKIKKN